MLKTNTDNVEQHQEIKAISKVDRTSGKFLTNMYLLKEKDKDNRSVIRFQKVELIHTLPVL